MVLAHIKEREVICDQFVELVRSANFQYDYIAGLATAGIAHAMLLADRLKSKMIYVRSSPKAHGRGNLIEGECPKGSNLLLVEDLINQASSLEKAVVGIRAEGMNPIGCLSIVDYQMDRAKEVALRLSIPILSLTRFEDVARCAMERGQVNEQQFKELLKWQRDPAAWS